MKTLLGIFLTVMLIVLTACGEVITPQPTTEVALPVSTSPSVATLTLPPRLTATAPLLPPATTATPTVTPTPIVHIVQAGEALYTIALAYGVSVEALQNANGVTDPQFLQLGQELIIPTGEEATETTFGVLLPTPTPLPLEKRGIAFYETPVGSLLGLGEIVNTTGFNITNVQVRVTLFDAAGALLTEADAFVDADLIPPGERSPFRILFTAPPPTWASYEVTIIRGEEAGPLTDSYVPIAVTEVEGGLSGSQFQVSGVVQNASDGRGAENVHVIVTTYDAQGLVTGSRQSAVEIEGTLAPGATAPFGSLFTFYGDVPADFHVIALGRVSTE
jgi:LysM repeat protein